MKVQFGPRAGVTVLLTCAWLCSLAAGCGEATESMRMNAPPQGEGWERPGWAHYYTYHQDQAMLADRSLADIHFVPGTADLSGTGVARLDRYAELLATTGGCLQYTPTIRDTSLIDTRLATAVAYLSEAIPGAKTVQVVMGLAGGRGMHSAEASSGRKEAEQAEPRGTAYHISVDAPGK